MDNSSTTVELRGITDESLSFMERWITSINPTNTKNGTESRNNVDVTCRRHCWGQLFTCNSCINLHDREFTVSRRLILKMNTAKRSKIQRSISRNHFVLKLQHIVNGLHTVRIKDLSTRGTFINGRRIGSNETITLFDDDVISVVRPNYQLFRFKDLSNKRNA